MVVYDFACQTMSLTNMRTYTYYPFIVIFNQMIPPPKGGLSPNLVILTHPHLTNAIYILRSRTSFT